MIVKKRLALVVEDRKLVAEEQGGFRKGRGCRDQILTLMLVGQLHMAMRKRGMMAAFIELKKVYDIVDRETLLDCLEHLGLRGRRDDWPETRVCNFTIALLTACMLMPW